MTPMIDCVFQLLLFFLIGSSFRNEGNIPGSIPRSGSGTEAQGPLLVVIVRQEGVGGESKPIYGVKLIRENLVQVPGGMPVAKYRQEMAKALYEELVRARSDVSDPKVLAVIRPEVDYASAKPGEYPYVMWQYVVDAYNQVLRAGFDKVAFQWQELSGGTF
jgi:hypothetical protein